LSGAGGTGRPLSYNSGVNLFLAVFDMSSQSRASWDATMAASLYVAALIGLALAWFLVRGLRTLWFAVRHRQRPERTGRSWDWVTWAFLAALISTFGVYQIAYEVAIRPARMQCAQFWRILTADDRMGGPIPADRLPAPNEGIYVDRCVAGAFDD
jgi:hypothetical protein